MSPVASGSPPYTRATTSNGGGPVRAVNGVASSDIDILKGNARKFPHLDDLLGARPDVNINTPFKTILQKGEELSRQADTHLDFRRPEIALQDYVKAAIIAVEILPKHKDFSALQDRPELNRLYLGLSKRINAQHLKFTDVKDAIKENNTLYGAKPAVDTISTGTGSLRLENADRSHGRTRSDQTAISPGKKVPPPVQPKPNALLGQAISHTSNETMPADLAARFARLRSPDHSPQAQDPRIRTQPIYADSNLPVSARIQTSTPRPIGPRELPSVPTSNIQPRIKVDVNIPGMPKAPDAIYSPDRGDESNANANLRSSASFTNVRKYSAPPISTVGPSPLLLDIRRDYFALASTVSMPSVNSLKRKEPSIPGSVTISPEDLMKYTGSDPRSLRVLLVDLRSREEFDSGHIMSQSIICVEPITLRHGISGEELENTMVVAPDNEQELYQKRQEFDLVVVYDQDSTSLGTSSRNESNGKLQDFMSAVYDYGYDKRLKRCPALLVGGLNGWVDLLGPNALQASTSAATAKTRGKPNPPLTRAFALRNSYYNDISKRRASRQLSSQEQNLWETKLSAKGEDSENIASEEFSYAKTTDDFFRRYPEVHTFQQSMVSSPTVLTLQQQRLDDELRAMSPRPPTRPAPALPRQRSSGINGPRLVASPAHTVPITSITGNYRPSALTGLTNPLQTCYLNSVVQALSATVFIRDFLRNFTYPPPADQIIPTREGENGGRCPQLMIRCFGNLLGHLWQGNYDYVAPSTFLEYVRSVDSPLKSNAERFAMGGQQDAGEFYLWLITLLEDESNPRRNAKPVDEIPDQDRVRLAIDGVGIVNACEEARRILFNNYRSPISKGMNFITHYEGVCSVCAKRTRNWDIQKVFQCMAPSYRSSGAKDLTSFLETLYGGPRESVGEFLCDCGSRGTTSRQVSISHFPDHLAINVGRFVAGEGTTSAKSQDLIPFGEVIDLSKCQVQIPADEANVPRVPEATGPFKYELYAIVRHWGPSRSGGHYTAYTKHLDVTPNPINGIPAAGSWHQYNDTGVAVCPPNEIKSSEMFKNATMLFYRRIKAGR